MNKKKELEEGLGFTPHFDAEGLIACITVCALSGDVLMFAFMNEHALDLTLKTRQVHYWSRSRRCLWHKGATSGFVQIVKEILVDCDQDCLLLKVDVVKPSASDSQNDGTCHTGRQSCFYRALDLQTPLKNPVGLYFIK